MRAIRCSLAGRLPQGRHTAERVPRSSGQGGLQGRFRCLLLGLALVASLGSQNSAVAQVTFSVPDGQVSETFDSGSVFPAGPPCYWIASSRRLPQQPSECRAWHLDYFQQTHDGSVQATSLSTLVAQMVPGAPICIFIHGSFVDVEWHRREARATYPWIRCAAPHLPLNVIFYTWPSDAQRTYIPQVDVNQRGRWAANNAFYLADLIAQLPPGTPVCLVGHSHGCRSVAATLHLIGGGSIANYSYPSTSGLQRRYRAVLAAAAIDRHWLNPGERYGCALFPTEGLVNLVNRTDWALHFYPLRQFFSRKALATTGFTRTDRLRLGDLNPKAFDLDVTALIGCGHYWPNYIEHPELAAALVPYVYFPECWSNPVMGRSAEGGPPTAGPQAQAEPRAGDLAGRGQSTEASVVVPAIAEGLAPDFITWSQGDIDQQPAGQAER